MQADVRPADCEKVLAALNGAARLTRREIHEQVFKCHRTRAQLEALGQHLEGDGRIVRNRTEPAGGSDRRPTEVWIINMQSMTPNDPAGQSDTEGPPAGEGWLLRAPLVRRARRGVMPAHARRVGERVRRNEISRRKGSGKGQQLVSDEERGATHLITEAINTYRRQGIVEVDGPWIRLAKNPPRRPPHHWHEALLQFLAEGHPTLDGKYRRKPSNLTEAAEFALGRRLLPHEHVRRRPDAPGSWDLSDIVLLDFEGDRMVTLAEISAEKEGRRR